MKKRFIIIIAAVSLLLTALTGGILWGILYHESNTPQENDTVVLSQQQHDYLKKCIADEDRKSPFAFGTFGVVKHMALKGGHMRMFVELNSRIYQLSGLSQEPEIVKRDLFLNLCNMDDSYDPLFEKLAANKVGLRIELGKDAIEEILEIYFTADELSNVAHSKRQDLDPHQILQSHVDVYNLSLPLKLDDVLTLSSVEMLPDYLLYNHIVREVKGNEMNRIRAGKQKMAKGILHSLFSSQNPAIQEVIELCRKSRSGMIYRYTGEQSGQQVTIYFDQSYFTHPQNFTTGENPQS